MKPSYAPGRRLLPVSETVIDWLLCPAGTVTLPRLTVTRALESLVSCRTVMVNVAAAPLTLVSGQLRLIGQRGDGPERNRRRLQRGGHVHRIRGIELARAGIGHVDVALQVRRASPC